MRKRTSLESRLYFLISAFLFSLLVAVCYWQMIDQQRLLAEAASRNYESLAKAFTLTCSYVPIQDRQEYYEKAANWFLAADPDISFVVISGEDGKVLFAKTRDNTGISSKKVQGMRSNKLMALMRDIGIPGNKYFSRVSMPVDVGSTKRGQVTVGFGSKSVDVANEEMRTRMIFAFALAGLTGLLVAFCLARAFTAPFKRLIAAARMVETGDLEVSLPEDASGEMRELADAFNRMVNSLKENRDRLEERANADSLTGLYNHRYFHEKLRSELKRAERYNRPLSVIMLDIDNFKSLNDAHGHPVGDTILSGLASILVSGVRADIDVVARYGGEEFALILPETDAESARACAEQLRKAVQRHIFTSKDGEAIPVTISLGVAQYPVHSKEREGLIMAADLAMYQSKSTGKNRTTVFSTDSRKDKDADPYKLHLLLQANDMSTLEAMAAAVDAKGERPQGFSRAVATDAILLAQELGMTPKERNDVRIACLLHDIGKLGISDAILNKRDPLTDEERDIIRSHPAIGYAIVQRSEQLKSMLPGILHHHEWWDGNGYPSGLKGEDIPFIARVISVVDAYHAMLTQRPHCGPKSPNDAREELRRCAGTQFDPKIVESYLKILKRQDALREAA